MLDVVFSSFALVALSEMGDKTQLLAFSLAAKFKRPWAVLAGILVATLLNHALASAAGSWIAGQFSPRAMAYVLAVTFFAFGIWTLKPDEPGGESEVGRSGAFVTTAVLFFIAEMGDKTQLATVALAARFQSVIAVTLGTTLGMLLSDGLAVWAGEKLAHRVQARAVRWLAASLFFAFGVAALLAARSS